MSRQPGPIPPAPGPAGSLDWRIRGACRGAPDPDRFLAGKPNDKAVGTAGRYCARCAVRAECLAYATRTRSQGIWGGWWFPMPGHGEPVDLLGGAA